MKKKKSKYNDGFLSNLQFLHISPEKVEFVSKQLPGLIWIKNHPNGTLYIHIINVIYA